jgi:integrase
MAGRAAAANTRAIQVRVREGSNTRATRTKRHSAAHRASLARAIRYAEAHDLVGRNAATLVDPPKGQIGRLSRSLTLDQSHALLEAARESRLYAYVVLSLCVGIRTEEARELRWDHLDLDGDPGVARPAPPSVAVWRSVRQGGDTKTAKSRRTLALPRRPFRLSGSTASGKQRTG